MTDKQMIRGMLKYGVTGDMHAACQQLECKEGGCDNPGTYCKDCFCAVCTSASSKHCQPKVDIGKLIGTTKPGESHTPAKRKAPAAKVDGHKWKRMDRDLKAGDVLRTKVGNQDNPNYGQYVYSITTGVGNGNHMHGMGNAIFVDFESFDLDMVLRAQPSYDPHGTTKGRSGRWEAFWGIEILDE